MSESERSMSESNETSGSVEQVGQPKGRTSLDTAREKLHEVSESVKQQAGRVGESVKQRANRTSELARERYDVAAQSLREGYDRASKDLDKLSKDVSAYVRDNPGRSVLAAAAAGFFIGLLVRRGRRH